jgi:hypothetical protein
VDLFINAVLTASSVALLSYWFRYGCLLILAAETAHDYSEEVALANQLSFPEIRARLRRRDDKDLDGLRTCLERDFIIVNYLLEHTPIASLGSPLEDGMLKILYRTLSTGFSLTRRSMREFELDALKEMALIVAHLANEFGERSVALRVGFTRQDGCLRYLEQR